MEASVIVPSCGRPITVRRTLQSVLAADAARHDVEIIVIDNNSEEHFSLDLRSFCGSLGHPVRYLAEPSPGVAAARHRGAKEARGEILLFIDDDVEVSSGWLGAVLEVFRGSDVGIVGGPSIPRFTGAVPAWLWDFIEPGPLGGWHCSWLSLLDIGKSVEAIDADWIWSLNLSVRRKLFVGVGGQHPCYVPPAVQRWQGDGELGFTSRAKASGARATYVHEALIYHLIGVDRLNPDYFARRSRYQAVCDSFTAIRGGAQPSLSGQTPPAPPAPTRTTPWSRVAEEIWKVVAAAYEQGWAFHQGEAARDPRLLEWIRRDNYWDADIRDQARRFEASR